MHYAHSYGSENHHLATTVVINDEQGNDRGSQIKRPITSSEETCERRAKSERILEDRLCEIRHQIRSTSLLEEPRRICNAHSPSIHLGAIAIEFFGRKRFAGRGFFDFLNVRDLFLDLWIFWTRFL
jgi:hypothetical protein